MVIMRMLDEESVESLSCSKQKSEVIITMNQNEER
jgi:hypothetical protein